MLNYAGTGVNAFRELSEKVKEDIGIEIQYTTLTSDDVVKRAVTQPTSFDILDSEYWISMPISSFTFSDSGVIGAGRGKGGL